MASGRRDYTWGALQDIVQPGPNSSNYSNYWQSNIGAGLTSKVATYTVPDGYTFFLFGVIVTCRFPGINRFQIYDDPDLIAEVNFDITGSWMPGQWGSYAMDEGDILNCYVTNRDGVTVEMTVMVCGLLEEIV